MHHPYMPMPPCPILGIVYNRPMAGLNIISQTWELYDFPCMHAVLGFHHRNWWNSIIFPNTGILIFLWCVYIYLQSMLCFSAEVFIAHWLLIQLMQTQCSFILVQCGQQVFINLVIFNKMEWGNARDLNALSLYPDELSASLMKLFYFISCSQSTVLDVAQCHFLQDATRYVLSFLLLKHILNLHNYVWPLNLHWYFT